MKAKKISEITKKPTQDQAYDAGYNCGLYGANTENCHFEFFCSLEHTAAWERGKIDAYKKQGIGGDAE